MPNSESSAGSAPRRWPRLAAFTAIPILAALSIYAFIPKKAGKAGPAGAGCNHAASAVSAASCPHGMDANGGCAMNGGPASIPSTEKGSVVRSRSREELDWVLPNGWTSERVTTGMRYATIKPGGEAQLDVSVIPLDGRAGGELANVNRWRGQIGLEAIDEKVLAGLRRELKSQAGPVALFDLNNPKNPSGRMVVGMVTPKGGSTWFLKMAGPDESVSKAKPAFLKVLESLHTK